MSATPNNPMKILFDVSVIGYGIQSQLARTGIYRAVSGLATALLCFEECKLTMFCKPPDSWRIYKYFSERSNLQIPSFCPSAGSRVFRNSKRLLSVADEWLGKSCSEGTFKRRAAQMTLNYANRFLDISGSAADQASFLRNDIFHSNYWASVRDVRRKGIRIFHTIYDLIQILHPEYFPEADAKSPIRKYLRELTEQDYTLCISESTKNDLLSYNSRIDPKKCFVAPLAASEIFYPCASKERISFVKSKYGIPPHCHYVLSVCTLEPRKNLKRLVNSFKKVVLSQKITDLCLVLTGAMGWQYTDLQQVIENVGISIPIITTGFVLDNDLGPLYTGALAFAYPSLYEGFGLPVLEAMQCGTPVVTSNTSSLPEVAANAGLLVNPKSEDEIAQALLDLYSDQNKRNLLSELGIKRALQFSWERCADATVKAYKVAMQS